MSQLSFAEVVETTKVETALTSSQIHKLKELRAAVERNDDRGLQHEVEEGEAYSQLIKFRGQKDMVVQGVLTDDKMLTLYALPVQGTSSSPARFVPTTEERAKVRNKFAKDAPGNDKTNKMFDAPARPFDLMTNWVAVSRGWELQELAVARSKNGSPVQVQRLYRTESLQLATDGGLTSTITVVTRHGRLAYKLPPRAPGNILTFFGDDAGFTVETDAGAEFRFKIDGSANSGTMEISFAGHQILDARAQRFEKTTLKPNCVAAVGG